MPENIKTVQFDGTVEQIENIKNRRTALNTVDDKTYPTTKAVKDYVDSKIVKLDQTYNPASENAQSGTAVAQAVESETTRADNTYANALKGLSSGEAVAMNDVSPVSHEMGVKVRGKNLSVNLSDRTDVFFAGSPTTVYNVTGKQLIKGFAVNGNADKIYFTEFTNSGGTVSFKTTNINYTLGIDCNVTSEQTYTLSAVTSGISAFWTVFLKDGLFHSYKTTNTFTVPDGCNQIIVLMRPETADTVCTVSSFQLELGTSATPYAPYISDFTEVKVKKQGKNLFDINAVFNTAADKYEITGNRLRVYANRAYDAGCMYRIYLPVGTTYTVRYDVEYGGTAERVYNEIGGNQITGSPSEVLRTYTVPALGYVQLEFARLGGGNDKLGWVDFSNIQLEIGSAATDYIPYIVAEYTPDSDGNVKGVISLYPTTKLMTDTAGAIIDCEYNRDINKAYGELLKRISALETAAVNNA